MSRPPRGLTPDEAALWAQVARTVRPLVKGADRKPVAQPALPKPKHSAATRVRAGSLAPPPEPVVGPRPTAVRPLDRDGLDASWERRLGRGLVAPDFTLDLHGYGLDAAHDRLDRGLSLALAQQARLVLVITGRPRPVEAADRGNRRGAIRAKLLDWLAAGPHASRIAAVRGAHQRHGGVGAVYLVLKRIKA